MRAIKKMQPINNSNLKQTDSGLIPEDWEVLNVGDVATINTESIGKNYFFREIEYLDTSSTDNGEVLDWQQLGIKEAPSRAKRILREGDIVISTVRPNLKHYALMKNVKENSVASTGYAVVRTEKADPRFLFYQLTTERVTEYLSKIADTSTSTYPSIRPEVIANLEFPFPAISEQQKIAEVLGALDEKIELNRRMNKTLESLGQAVYNHMFCHSELDSESMNLGKVGDVIEILDSKRIPLSSREREQKKGEFPYYGATSIMDYVDDYIFDGTYLLLGEDGSVAKEDGKPYTQYVWGKIWVNNHAHVLKGKNGFSTELLKIFFDNIDIQPFITGAVQPKLNQENMKNIPIHIPDDKTLEKVNDAIKPLFDKIKTNIRGIETLSQIRDSLLPRLMSGKLRIAE